MSEPSKTPTASISSEEQLEELLHHYLVMLERLKEDRAELFKQTSDLGKLVVRLGSQLDKFNEVEKTFRQQVIYSIDHASLKMAEKAGNEIKQSIAGEAKLACENLLKAVDKADKRLQEYEKEEKGNFIWFIIGLFTVPIVACLLFMWLVMPKPLLALSGNQLQTYQEGQFLQSFWHKLSKREQKHLSDLSSQSTNEDSDTNET